MKTILERARAYLARMPVSVSGQGGHTAAFNAAVTLNRGFELAEADALPLLIEWNTGCQPPWSEAALRTKLRSASSSSTKPMGYLLTDHKSTPHSKVVGIETDEDRKTRLRAKWPVMSRLTPAMIQSIADLRRLPFDAVDLGARAGFVAEAAVEGHRCFVIGEGLFVQARRFDGKAFTLGDGTTIKAKNLPGSEGAFIGQKWLGRDRPILLIEGAIGLLEATAAIVLTDRFDWTVLAATSASPRFSRAPELLKKLAGRRLRIVPDNDEAGLDAAASWLGDLEGCGCQVDVLSLPPNVKDLGPIVADPDHHKQTLNALFQ